MKAKGGPTTAGGCLPHSDSYTSPIPSSETEDIRAAGDRYLEPPAFLTTIPSPWRTAAGPWNESRGSTPVYLKGTNPRQLIHA